jgi:hypothetical protein
MKSDVAFIGAPAMSHAAAFDEFCELTAVYELMSDNRADPGQIARMRDPSLEVKVAPSKGRAAQAVA